MTKKKLKSNKKRGAIPLLSFFTGGGFLDIGFEQEGFEAVWTNECNADFSALYAHGMTAWKQSENTDTQERSISNTHNIDRIFAPEIIAEAFPQGKPVFFGIIGGPPCPDFSKGGKNRGGKGINGRFSKTYVHRICKIKPSFFVFENVPGLYKTKIHREFLARLEKSLERCGYCLDLKILNALDLGVPQDRERLIMIGIKQKYVKKVLGRSVDVSERNWFPWPVNPKYKNAKARFSWPSTKGTSSTLVLPDGVPQELTVYSIFNSGNCPSQIQNGNDMFKTYSDKFSMIKEGDTRRKSFKRLHRYRFSPTACYGHNEVHLHPWEKRRLSVREA
ncbi:MAG: hypothetical protein A2Y62_13480, partial [Candidatus Fischerbacteria bacterium RBG_13_37_8]